MTMVANSESVLKEALDKNPVARLWAKITSSSIFKIKILEFIKLAKITCVHVLGSFNDEWWFSAVALIKKQVKEPFVVPFGSLHNNYTNLRTSHLKWPFTFLGNMKT